MFASMHISLLLLSAGTDIIFEVTFFSNQTTKYKRNTSINGYARENKAPIAAGWVLSYL